MTNKEKAQLNKDISQMLKQNLNYLIKFMIFAFIALIVFFTITYLTSGRAIPYLAFLYIISFGFVFRNRIFGKKRAIYNSIDVILVIVMALIFVAMAVDMLGK